MEYLVIRDGSQFGPYEREALLAYIRQGVFHPADYGWHAGMSEWKPLGELLGLSVEFVRTGAQSHHAFSPVASPSKPPQTFSAGASRYRRGTMKRPHEKTKSRTGMIILNIFLVLAGAAAAYIKFGNGGAVLHRYFPSVVGMFQQPPGNASVAAPVGTPAPVTPRLAESTPQPIQPLTPLPVATPSPPPFDFAGLAANRALWPKVVRLKQASVFPAVFDGRVAGNLTVQPGAMVNLVDIEGESLVLSYSGGIQKVPWQMTDLDAEATRQAATVAELSPEVATTPAQAEVATTAKRRPSFMDSIPTDGLQLWLKADVGVTAGSENIVSAWADQSGSGHDAIQSSSAARPTVVPTALNGLPVIHFNAASAQYLELPNFLSRWTAGEIIVVVRAANTTTENGLWTFGTGHAEWYPYSPNGGLYGDFGAKLQQCEAPPQPTDDLTRFHVLNECSQKDLWQSWVDGMSFYRTKTNEVSFSSEPALGKCSDGGYFSGDIAELLIYDRPLNAGERDSLIDTLGEKYGLKRH